MLLHSFTTNAQVTIDTLASRVNGVWWTNNNILNDPNAISFDELATAGTTPAQIKGVYPPTVGVFTTVTWRSLAPTMNPFTGIAFYNWTDLDNTLKVYSDSNLLIMLMVWVGPDCPDWIYDSAFMRVPKANTDDPVRNKYPFYFYVATSSRPPFYNTGDSVYKKEWYKMMDSLAAYIKAYTGKLRKSIVIIQSAEGRTGDEGPYKGAYLPGTPNAYKISRSSPAWVAFRQAAPGNTLMHFIVSAYQYHLPVIIKNKYTYW